MVTQGLSLSTIDIWGQIFFIGTVERLVASYNIVDIVGYLASLASIHLDASTHPQLWQPKVSQHCQVYLRNKISFPIVQKVCALRYSEVFTLGEAP
jgi:hypothetical protein